MCFNGFTAKNSFENRHDMLHMTLISMPTLHLPQISKFEPFPLNFQNTMIGFHLRKMFKFIYKQISPKSDYFPYHDYIFVLFLYAALRLPPTMTSKSYFDPASFPQAMILKSPIFGVFEAKYLWKFLSISGNTYIIRIVSSRRIFKKKWRCHMHFKELCACEHIL